MSFLPTGTVIGSGRSNTALIIQACGTGTAAGLAANYRGGGKNDWFLPSKDELNALYQQRDAIGFFRPFGFWSSSQASEYAGYAWSLNFNSGAQVTGGKESGGRLRPVRAF